MERVVITGLGALSGLGAGAAVQFERARDGLSGIAPIDLELPIPVNTRMASQVRGFDDKSLQASEKSMFDRVAQLSWVAANEAIIQAGIGSLSQQELEQSGIFWGTGFGGASTIERTYQDLYLHKKDRVRPFSVIGVMANGAAGLLSLKTRFQGPSLTYSTACASSAHAIGEAFRQIRHGYCERAIAGGAESLLTVGTIKAWEALQTLASPDAENLAASCKPFSVNRSGFVLGEGAAALMFESLSAAQRRGANILGEIVGYGVSSDAAHITKPNPEGQARAMRAALAEAGVTPSDIAYVNAHGTATLAGDVAETQSLKLALGDHAKKVAISSTKAIHGHMLGAAGALELLITIQAQRNGYAPPTAFLENPDPECDLDYLPLMGRDMPIPYALSNSFAFGGSNAVLVTKAWK